MSNYVKFSTKKRGPEWRVNLGTVAGDTVTGDAIPTTQHAPMAWIAERAALLDQIAWLHQHVTAQSGHITELTRLLDSEREARAASAEASADAVPTDCGIEAAAPLVSSLVR